MLRGLCGHGCKGLPVITLYGIKNCDTVRKARRWLDARGVEYAYRDLREDRLAPQTVRDWLRDLGWQSLVNRRSTSWKQLPTATRDAMDDELAQRCILEHPTLIRRPLLDTGHERLAGFSADTYRRLLDKHTL